MDDYSEYIDGVIDSYRVQDIMGESRIMFIDKWPLIWSPRQGIVWPHPPMKESLETKMVRFLEALKEEE